MKWGVSIRIISLKYFEMFSLENMNSSTTSVSFFFFFLHKQLSTLMFLVAGGFSLTTVTVEYSKCMRTSLFNIKEVWQLFCFPSN